MYEILFWSLFTTYPGRDGQTLSLFMICMRYYFEAYSQRDIVCCAIKCSCLWYVWDTILKPIHNQRYDVKEHGIVVYDMYEILFWSLFTTTTYFDINATRLFMICMRYYFEAYSQPSSLILDKSMSCLWYVWDTILKPIHNVSGPSSVPSVLFMICMRYYFEAYSQPRPSLGRSPLRCLWYVWDTILKPIHNYHFFYVPKAYVVYDTYEIRFCQLFKERRCNFIFIFCKGRK